METTINIDTEWFDENENNVNQYDCCSHQVSTNIQHHHQNTKHEHHIFWQEDGCSGDLWLDNTLLRDLRFAMMCHLSVAQKPNTTCGYSEVPKPCYPLFFSPTQLVWSQPHASCDILTTQYFFSPLLRS